ncbi:MAG: 1-acyl-sn-glycerol-3-phosphate acyltransferase [Geminicoccaceae bacterium]
MDAEKAEGSAAHIVDELILERAPGLSGNQLSRAFLRRGLYRMLLYPEAVRVADEIAPQSGLEVLETLSQLLKIDLEVDGLQNLPATGRVVVAPNHPTGIADGIALYDAIKGVRTDFSVFANGDAIRVAPGLEDVIIPVEWEEAKRSHGSSRATLMRAARDFRDNQCVVLFPSGRMAYMSWTGLRERPWQPTIISLARKFKAPIVPLHIYSRNSWVFYTFSKISNELRDVTLFREFLNKRGQKFRLCFGQPIDANSLNADPAKAVAELQQVVEVEMKREGFSDKLLGLKRPKPAPV